MPQHNPESLNSEEHANDEAKEKRKEAMFGRRKEAMFGRMIGIARSVGGSFTENRALRCIEFKTWQDALDFQSFCMEEMKFPVRIEDPPQWAAPIQGHRVYPVCE